MKIKKAGIVWAKRLRSVSRTSMTPTMEANRKSESPILAHIGKHMNYHYLHFAPRNYGNSYVVAEFVFIGSRGHITYVRIIRYLT